MADQPQALLTRAERGRFRVLLVFCLGGIALLFGPTSSRRTGIGVLLLFGSALAQLLFRVRRRLGERDSASATGVSVPGGVPVRERRSRPIALGTSMIVVGVVFVWAFGEGARTPLVLGALVVALGVLSLALLPLVGHRALQFDPEGLLVVERTFWFRVPWDEITAVRTTERYGQSFVVVVVRDPLTLMALAQARTTRGGDGAPHFRRYLTRQRAWTGADVLIDAGMFGLDSVLLARAIARYVSSSSARAELAVRRVGERTA
jgi:hypothetical protein